MVAWLLDPLLAGRPARISGTGTPRINPIAGADLAQLARECVDEGGAANRELPVGGPDVFTLKQMASLAAVVAGRDPAASVKTRGLWGLRLLAPLARCFAPLAPGAAALADGARFVLYSATHDAVGDSSGTRTLEAAFRERAAAAAAPRRGRRTASTEQVPAAAGGGGGGAPAAP